MYKYTKNNGYILLTIFVFIIASIFIFPIIWLALSSFKTSSELFGYPLHLFPQQFSIESYVSVIKNGFFRYVFNSLFLAVVGTTITVLISSMCGIALAIYRTEIKYANLVFGIFLQFAEQTSILKEKCLQT